MVTLGGRAFAINHKDYDFALANDIREIYLKDGYERKPLTQKHPFSCRLSRQCMFLLWGISHGY